MNIQQTPALSLSIVLLLAVNIVAQCPNNNQPLLLQTGNHLFTNGRSFSPINRQHFYQFPISYTVPASGLQITASAAAFSVSSQFGIDFFIRAGVGQSPQTAVVALIINEDNSWTNIKVHYLVTSRQDFRVGFFSIDTFFLQRNNPNTAFSFTHSLPNWTSTNQRVTVVTELSGMKTSSATYLASLERVSISGNNGEITVIIRLSSNPLFEQLDISFIVFKQSAPFAITPFSTQNPPQLNAYQFIGIERIANGNSIDAGVVLTSTAAAQLPCVGSNCPPQPCLTAEECNANSGRVLNQKCLICGLGQVIIGDECRSNPVVQCPVNQINNNGECVCQAFYVRVNGVCYRLCANNAAFINSQCQCIPGFTFSSQARACIETNAVSCPPNYTPVNGQCQCQAPRGLVNTSCVFCPAFSFRANNGRCICNPGYTLNADILTCQQNCQLNSHRNPDGNCVCDDGYFPSGNQCLPAPSCLNGKVWNGAMCVCPPGQLIDTFTSVCVSCDPPSRAMNGTQCICAKDYRPTPIGCQACPANSYYSSSNSQCTCNSGFYRNGDSCLRSQNCPSRSTWNARLNICECQFMDQHVFNGFCQPCPRNSKWNGSDCACNANFNKVEDQCVRECPTNEMWNGISCICNRGLFRVAGRCTECSVNSQYNALTQVCVCKDGWIGNGLNCVCPNGRFVIDSQCVTCDVNSIYSDSLKTCVCRNGWYGNYELCTQCDDSCTTCSGPSNQNCLQCAAGFERQGDDSCTRECPDNSSWDGTACNCNPGFGLLAGNCVVSCPFNSQWNGQKCECISGLNLIDNNCVRCHPSSVYNQSLLTCTCIDGWFGDYTLCQQCHSTCLTCSGSTNRDCLSCYENYRLNNNGRCRIQSCPERSFISGNTCKDCSQNCIQCDDKNTCTRCDPGYDVATDKSCVLSAGCLNNSAWNGTHCECIPGFYLIEGLCQACARNSVYDSVSQTCNCIDGWWGTFQRCRRCHETCQTCSSNGQRNCLSCPVGFELRNNGRCRQIEVVAPVTCSEGFYPNDGVCSVCLDNCIECMNDATCDSCKDGFSVVKQIKGQSIVEACETVKTGTSSTISLTNSVIGNGVVFQGVTMDLMPIPILVLDCSLCDDLLLVETSSLVADVTFTTEYVQNSQYWFVVIFNVGSTFFIPSFSFSVRINPAYQQYFSNADMQQKLEGFHGEPDTEVTTRPTLGPVRSGNTAPPSLIPSSSGQGGESQGETSAPELNDKTIVALFS